CGHCKKMKPEYEKAAEFLHAGSDSPGVLAAVDATVNKALAERYHISGFPTVKYFKDGEEKYTLPHLRTKKKIIDWLQNPEAPPPPEPAWEEKQSSVVHLAGEDFRESLKKKKHTLVMFYAPWCPHCKNAIPHFTTAAEVFKEDRKIAYAAVDCAKDQNHDLCKQEGVDGYPTFNYYNYGKFVEKYTGERGLLMKLFASSEEMQIHEIAFCANNFIQRTKQRYNNTRSLSTKMNLADMQTEIKLRPPYQISLSELGSANGFAHLSAAEYKGTAPHQRLEPVTLPGIVSFVLSLLCGALNLIRGFHAIESLLQNEGEDFSYVIAFFLGTAACLYQVVDENIWCSLSVKVSSDGDYTVYFKYKFLSLSVSTLLSFGFEYIY
ncbi:hypothetical protein CIB84_000794, partial [Bambusicola thoracicus]